jgi:hypothetical protein
MEAKKWKQEQLEAMRRRNPSEWSWDLGRLPGKRTVGKDI